MEQKDKLATLVEQVDREAQAFTSFDDYLAAKGRAAIPNPDNIPGLESAERNEWEKSVVAAKENSSPNSSEKVDETVESSSQSSVAPVTEPVEPKEKTWSREAPYTSLPERTEQLSHPTAPNVTAPLPPFEPNAEVAEYVTILKVVNVNWPSSTPTSHVSEEQVLRGSDEHLATITDPAELEAEVKLRDAKKLDESGRDENSPNSVYLRGREFCAKAASIEAIREHYHFVEREMLKIRDYQRGLRSGFEKRITEANMPGRMDLLDRDSIASRNLKQANRMKVERAPKSYDAEIRKAAQILLDASMADTLDEAIEKVRASRIKKGLPV